MPGYTQQNGVTYRMYQFRTNIKLFNTRFKFYWRFSLDPGTDMFTWLPKKRPFFDDWSKDVIRGNFDCKGYILGWLFWDMIIAKEIK